MATAPDFVIELIRAANEADRMSTSEGRRLIKRSIVVIREMRGDIGIPRDGTPRDQLLELRRAAAQGDSLRHGELAAILLVAADMIRTLHVVIDSGTDVVITGMTD